ncbi:MAG: class A beta-lactamase-related serine hydrolase [Actinomycetota bacterium]|nr:class A beta-lactamase-related serine hydrolase [Actinomycetota bacterium]
MLQGADPLNWPPALAALAPRPDADAGLVSVWCGPPGGPPSCARLPDSQHYAASTIKLPLLVAAYRLAGAGALDLDQPVVIHDEFESIAGGRFRMDRGYDNDEAPWERLGTPVALRWLARRMIVRSSNLATSLVLQRTGLPAVAEALAACGATRSVLGRPICDETAIAAGVTNLVTAGDLAAVLGALATGRAAAADACAEMLEVLEAQEYRDEIPAGLPAGTAVAGKGGWVEGVLHDAALVRPPDAPAYVLVVCTTGLAENDGRNLIREVAAASWSDRHWIGSAR